MKPQRWTAEDLLKLNSMAQKYPAAQIAAELGRGYSSVTIKAHELRISLRVKARRASPKANIDPGPSGIDLPA
jgi:hypothetical protein